MPLPPLLFSFDGRIGRLSFWLGSLILVVVEITVIMLLLALFGSPTDLTDAAATPETTQAFGVFGMIAFLLVLYPSLALIVKRLNAFNFHSAQAAVYIVPGVVALMIDMFVLGGPLGQRNSLGSAIDIVELLVIALTVYDLGLRPAPGERWFA